MPSFEVFPVTVYGELYGWYWAAALARRDAHGSSARSLPQRAGSARGCSSQQPGEARRRPRTRVKRVPA